MIKVQYSTAFSKPNTAFLLDDGHTLKCRIDEGGEERVVELPRVRGYGDRGARERRRGPVLVAPVYRHGRDEHRRGGAGAVLHRPRIRARRSADALAQRRQAAGAFLRRSPLGSPLHVDLQRHDPVMAEVEGQIGQ